MSIRTRKFIGAILLLLLVAVWALLAMAVAQFVFTSTNSLAAWIYYVVAGIGWVLPAMPLIRWMSQADEARADRAVRRPCRGLNLFHIAVAAPDISTRT